MEHLVDADVLISNIKRIPIQMGSPGLEGEGERWHVHNCAWRLLHSVLSKGLNAETRLLRECHVCKDRHKMHNV